MKKMIIDRVEEDFAVCECEDLSHILIPVEVFSFDVREGMHIILHSDGVYTEDKESEDEALSRILELQRKLMNKNKE